VMHGREKSGSAIVAVKPTNKAVPTAAEPAEPRAGAKGNARKKAVFRSLVEVICSSTSENFAHREFPENRSPCWVLHRFPDQRSLLDLFSTISRIARSRRETARDS
jgi:hypothetical protein